jgi:hypothetical protein
MRQLALALVLTGVTFLAAQAAAGPNRLPDSLLGTWCVAAESSASRYDIFMRAQCERDKELLVGPNRIRAFWLDCRVLRVDGPKEMRHGPMWQVTLRCKGEGDRDAGVQTIKVWDIGDGLMVGKNDGKWYE